MRRLALLLLFTAAGAFGADRPLIVLRTIEPHAPDAGNVAIWRFVLVNRSSEPQNGVEFTFEPYSAAVAFPAGCGKTGFHDDLACTVNVPANGQSEELVFAVQLPDTTSRYGRQVVNVRVDGDHHRIEAPFAHEFAVTNTNDSGPGSLRDAIQQVNARCPLGATPEWKYDPCLIAFAIDEPMPREGWFTIQPRTPLPPISGYDVFVDGLRQSPGFGAPSVMLDGRKTSGNGLTLQCERCTVKGLSIGFFSQNAIEVAPPPNRGTLYEIRRNYLGVDPSGFGAAPNGWRGMQITYGAGAIEDNVISANRRAGIFIGIGGGQEIRDNLIGTGADAVTPLGNRASGAYINVPLPSNYAKEPVPYRVSVFNNVVAYNAQAGIAVTYATDLSIGRNRMFYNAGAAIDIGLDGSSLPIITSARYANGVTTISGVTSLPATVFLYANGAIKRDGSAEAEEFIGTAKSTTAATALPTFTFSIERDLRGRFITAQWSAFTMGQIPNGCICDIPEQHYRSSEISRPMVVQ